MARAKTKVVEEPIEEELDELEEEDELEDLDDLDEDDSDDSDDADEDSDEDEGESDADDDLDDLEEVEDEEVEEKPKTRKARKQAAGKSAAPKKAKIEFDTKWLAAHISESTKNPVDPRKLRMHLRALAKKGELDRTIGEDRSRYDFAPGAKNETVKALVAAAKKGTFDASGRKGNPEALAKARAARAANKAEGKTPAKKAKKAAKGKKAAKK